MKACKDCFRAKPLSEFYKDKRYKDGHYKRCKVCHKAWMKRHRSTEEQFEMRKAYHKENIDYYRKLNREYQRRQREENGFVYKIVNKMRHRVLYALRSDCKDPNRMIETIGCTAPFLRHYLEERFKPGMTWENRDEWHIDHKIPLSAFDFTKPGQQEICFHYSNLQPLWSRDNILKGAKIPANFLFSGSRRNQLVST